MYTNNKLSKAVRLAIAFGAASATAFTASVNAQEEGEIAKVERIEVTGSRIKRTDMEGVAPVTVISASSASAANAGAVLISRAANNRGRVRVNRERYFMGILLEFHRR